MNGTYSTNDEMTGIPLTVETLEKAVKALREIEPPQSHLDCVRYNCSKEKFLSVMGIKIVEYRSDVSSLCGLPVLYDESLPEGEIELRDREGHILCRGNFNDTE